MFPENEVQWVVFGSIHLHPLAGSQVVDRLARELAVARKLADREIHISVSGLIGQAVAFQLSDQFEHLRHVRGGARFMIRLLDPECRGVCVHEVDETGRQFADALFVFLRAPDDLVIDVGNVADVGHLQSARPQPPLNHVEDHQHAGVPEVAEVVDRHSADIHADLARGDRHEVLLFPGQRVVNLQHIQAHEVTPRRPVRVWSALVSTQFLLESTGQATLNRGYAQYTIAIHLISPKSLAACRCPLSGSSRPLPDPLPARKSSLQQVKIDKLDNQMTKRRCRIPEDGRIENHH